MKSPQQLSRQLAKQWQSADYREQRLLSNAQWPLKLSIIRPDARSLIHSPDKVREHLQAWRAVKTGQVLWSDSNYKSASQAINVPLYWQINNPSEWISACAEQQINHEFQILSEIISEVDPLFHSLFVRQRSSWLNSNTADVIKCAELAMLLEAGIAEGRPLRGLSIANIDTKFIEKNRNLLIKLLNIRFDNIMQTLSLETFLNAADDKDQWLLIIPLADNLLPYQQLRLRASELSGITLPGSHLLVIENEHCRHQLPHLDNTLAILGAGLNLGWLENANFNDKHIAYWGDIDTWGLKMLANARQLQSSLSALLMTQTIYNTYKNYAVPEPQNAGEQGPAALTQAENQLYHSLLNSSKGRLEQEFIPAEQVKKIITQWYSDCFQG